MLQLGVSLLCSGPVNLLLFPSTNLEQFYSSVIIFGGMNKIKKKDKMLPLQRASAAEPRFAAAAAWPSPAALTT